MNSYLQTLKHLQTNHSDAQFIQQASKYNTYEEYLHRRSKLRQHVSQPQLKGRTEIPKSYEYEQNNPQLKKKSQAVFYPVHRTETQYHNRQYVQRIPKKKKVVEYIERKEVEIVPKQITKTHYYAVQHLKSYKKQVVPEVRIQTVQVPKTVKNVQYIPKEKQIIYYPSHLTDIREIKERAKIQLGKQGVIVKQDAEFKPLDTAIKNEQVNTLSERLNKQIQQAQEKLKKIQQIQKQEANRNVDRTYYQLAPPKDHKRQLRTDFVRETGKHVTWDNDLVYQKLRQQNSLQKSYASRNNMTNYSYQYGIDSSFAERDLYRYNLLVNNSIRSKY